MYNNFYYPSSELAANDEFFDNMSDALAQNIHTHIVKVQKSVTHILHDAHPPSKEEKRLAHHCSKLASLKKYLSGCQSDMQLAVLERLGELSLEYQTHAHPIHIFSGLPASKQRIIPLKSLLSYSSESEILWILELGKLYNIPPQELENIILLSSRNHL